MRSAAALLLGGAVACDKASAPVRTVVLAGGILILVPVAGEYDRSKRT